MISHDLPCLKPTFFPSVPRLFNKIYSKILDELKGTEGCMRWIVNRAIQSKLHNLKLKGQVSHPCYDAIIFNKIK